MHFNKYRLALNKCTMWSISLSFLAIHVVRFLMSYWEEIQINTDGVVLSWGAKSGNYVP